MSDYAVFHGAAKILLARVMRNTEQTATVPLKSRTLLELLVAYALILITVSLLSTRGEWKYSIIGGVLR